MGFNSGFELVINGADRQIALQLLERLLDLDQLQIKAPQIAGIIALDIGAQQIAAFAPPGLPQSMQQVASPVYGVHNVRLRYRVCWRARCRGSLGGRPGIAVVFTTLLVSSPARGEK